jgi:hypothetical protein
MLSKVSERRWRGKEKVTNPLLRETLALWQGFRIELKGSDIYSGAARREPGGCVPVVLSSDKRWSSVSDGFSYTKTTRPQE